MLERTQVYVDTSYLLASFYNSWATGARAQLEIDLPEVVAVLGHMIENQLGQPIQRQLWYDGIPDSGPHRYQRALRTCDGVQLRAGQLIEWGERRTQKAVDTRLVADMVVAGLKGQCSDMVLVSGDADMIPGVQEATAAGIRVHLYGFGWDSMSSALRHACDSTTILDPREDFAECMQLQVLEGPLPPNIPTKPIGDAEPIDEVGPTSVPSLVPKPAPAPNADEDAASTDAGDTAGDSTQPAVDSAEGNSTDVAAAGADTTEVTTAESTASGEGSSQSDAAQPAAQPGAEPAADSAASPAPTAAAATSPAQVSTTDVAADAPVGGDTPGTNDNGSDDTPAGDAITGTVVEHTDATPTPRPQPSPATMAQPAAKPTPATVRGVRVTAESTRINISRTGDTFTAQEDHVREEITVTTDRDLAGDAGTTEAATKNEQARHLQQVKEASSTQPDSVAEDERDNQSRPTPKPAPSPSMMAPRRKLRSRYVPLPNEVWASAGFQTPYDVGQQYATWWYNNAATAEQRDNAHLLSGGGLPPEVDRPLLQFACETLHEYTLNEQQRVSLRDGFHSGIRAVLLSRDSR